MGSEIIIAILGLVGVYLQSPEPQTVPANFDGIIEIAKIAVPAILAYLASRMQAKKEQRTAAIQREDRINVSWESMTVQVRELLAQEVAARRVVEARVFTLEQELTRLRQQYDEANEELEKLRLRTVKRPN